MSTGLSQQTLDTRRALLARRLNQAATTEKRRPLSFALQRLWFLDQLEPNSPLYNVATVAHVQGNLDFAALQHALHALSNRHEALRTTFVNSDAGPEQVIHPNLHPDLRSLDLTDCPDPDKTAADLTREEINRPFNL